MDELQRIIEQYLPTSFADLGAFEDFFASIKQSVQPAVVTIVKEVESVLGAEAAELTGREPLRRDCWRIFGADTPVKSAASVRSKLARDLRDEIDDSGVRPPRLSENEVKTRIFGFGDLGRCRIVCTFSRDVDYLLRRLILEDRLLGKYELRAPVKDFVFDPRRRDGLRGHRARQFSVNALATDNHPFGFEVQMMTELQHTWDRRNHPLYEWTREGGELPVELRVNDFACAETLHLVDQQADRNWEAFLQHAAQDKHSKDE